MSITIELTDSGVAAVNDFLAVLKPTVSREAIMSEVLDVLADRVAGDETLVYWIAPQYTQSGRIESLALSLDDIVIRKD